jgi:hypothetical protein
MLFFLVKLFICAMSLFLKGHFRIALYCLFKYNCCYREKTLVFMGMIQSKCSLNFEFSLNIGTSIGIVHQKLWILLFGGRFQIFT